MAEYIDPSALDLNIFKFIEQDMEKLPAERVLDAQIAFYKVGIANESSSREY